MSVSVPEVLMLLGDKVVQVHERDTIINEKQKTIEEMARQMQNMRAIIDDQASELMKLRNKPVDVVEELKNNLALV